MNSDNVIHLRPSARPPSLDEERSSRRFEALRHRHHLVRAVRSAVKFISNNDLIEAGRAVERLFSEVRERKQKKNWTDDIKTALAKRGHEVLHWDRLRGRSKPELAVKKVPPYVDLVDALADVLGYDADDAIYDAFRNTKFSHNTTGIADDPVDELCLLLGQMTTYVIREENVNDYFQQLRQFHACYDPAIEEFILGALDPEFQLAYEGSVDWCTTLHALPAVPLLRVHRARFSGPLLVERQPIALANSSSSQAAAMCNQRKRPFGSTDVVDAEILLYTDIRLAIGPRTRAEDLGPLFETRSYVELKTDGVLRPLTFSLALFPLYARPDDDGELAGFVGSVAARFDDGWRRIKGIVTPEWTGDGEPYRDHQEGREIARWSDSPEFFGVRLDAGLRFEPLFGHRFGSGEWAVCWDPVEPRTITQFKQLVSQPAPKRAWHWLFERVEPEAKPAESLFVYSDFQDFVDVLDAGVIERALCKECRRLKAKLKEGTDKRSDRLKQQADALLSRWQSKGNLD